MFYNIKALEFKELKSLFWLKIYWSRVWALIDHVFSPAAVEEDDKVRADGEPAGSDQAVQVLSARGAEQEGGAGGRRGPLLPEPQERPGPWSAHDV